MSVHVIQLMMELYNLFPFFTIKVAVYSEKDVEKKYNRDMNDYNIYLCAVCRYPVRNASW